MKIGILGGAFDPPHLGHFLISQQILDLKLVAQIWWLPCFSHPFDKKMTKPKDRLKMAKISVQEFGNKNILVKDFELNLSKKSYTIETVLFLKKKFPQNEFFWIIGSDNLSDFSKWKDPEKLVKEIPFLVFPRIDYPVNKTPQGFRIINQKDLILTNISSNIIREKIKKGQSVKGMVSEQTIGYIYRNKLYQ